MHCYFIPLNFFALYFYPKNTEETDSAASNQAKLFLMTLIFDLMLCDIVLYYLFFLPFWRFAGVRLKWQLTFNRCVLELEEEKLYASSAWLCETFN